MVKGKIIFLKNDEEFKELCPNIDLMCPGKDLVDISFFYKKYDTVHIKLWLRSDYNIGGEIIFCTSCQDLSDDYSISLLVVNDTMYIIGDEHNDITGIKFDWDRYTIYEQDNNKAIPVKELNLTIWFDWQTGIDISTPYIKDIEDEN